MSEICDWLVSLCETSGTGDSYVKFSRQDDHKLNKPPHMVSATAGDNFSIVAVDNLVVTLLDQDLFTHSFKAVVDDIDVLLPGYVIVGDRSGTLTLDVFSRSSQFELKQSIVLVQPPTQEDQPAFIRLLFERTEESKARILCLTYDGWLRIFDDILLADGDIDLSCVKQGKIITPHTRALDAATMGDTILTVGSGVTCLAAFASNNGQLALQDSASVVADELPEMLRIQIPTTAGIFLTLDSQGTLYAWDEVIMIPVKTWQLPDLLDFRLISNTPGRARLADMKILVFQSGKSHTLNLPSLTVQAEYGSPVDEGVFSKSSAAQEAVCVAEYKKVKDQGDSDATVCFRCYRERSPLERLQRLIARKKYDEAEKFAQTFGLPFVLDSDTVRIRMREAKETLAETSAHLQRCREMLVSQISDESSSAAVVLAELELLERKLAAYKLCFDEDDYSATEWQKFESVSPLVHCCHMLMVNEEKAFQLWSCFQEDLLHQMKPELIMEMLQRIPGRVDSHIVVNWLCQSVIPFVQGIVPATVTGIIQWLEEKVEQLEKNREATWEDQAKLLCVRVLETLEQVLDVKDLSFDNLKTIKIKMKCRLALLPLQTLVKNLDRLKELKVRFKFHMTLKMFSQETQESVAYRMLDQVMCVDQLAEVLSQQFLPYLKYQNVHPDKVLVSYLQDFFRRPDTFNKWEEKITALINIIENPTDKVTAVLSLLEAAALPLPSFIERLVSDVLAVVRHPVVSTLKEKWSIKEANNILVLNGLNPNDICDSYDIKAAAKYLIASCGSMIDAEKLLSAYKLSDNHSDLAIFQCELFIKRNQMEELAQFLRRQPSQLASRCCVFIITKATYMMDGETWFMQRTQALRFQHYEAAMIAYERLKPLTECILEDADLVKTVATIKLAWSLERSQGIYLTSAGEIQSESPTDLRSINQMAAGPTLYRLARQLMLNKGELLKLPERSADSPVVASLEEKVVSMYESHGPLPSRLTDDVVAIIVDHSLTVLSQCLQLAQLYLTFCPPELLSSTLEVCRLANTLLNCNQSSRSVQHTDWQELDLLDYDLYQDSPVPPSQHNSCQEVVEPLVSTILASDLPQGSCQELESSIQTLWRTGQYQLALQILTEFGRRLDMALVCLPDDQKKKWADLLDRTVNLTNKTCLSLTSKVLSMPRLDVVLAQALLLGLPPAQIKTRLQDSIKNCWHNYPKLKRVSMVSSSFAEILCDQELLARSQRVQAIAKWGNRFSKIGIPFPSTFQDGINTEDVVKAAHKFVQTPHCQVSLLEDLCRDFYITLVEKNYLMRQLLEFCLTAHTEHQFSPAMLRKADYVFKCLDGNKMKILTSLLEKTDSYNYEVLQFILEKMLSEKDSAETQHALVLLRYLQQYTRSKPPCEVELKHFETMSENKLEQSSLPAVASSRLPFHALVSKDNIWKIIGDEVNSRNLDLWLQMSSVLNISKDNLLLKAATNILSNYSSYSELSATSCGQEFYNMLAEINTILSQLEDKELAMCWCHSSFSKLTNVEEKTKVLEYCVRLAQTFLKSANEPQQVERATKSLKSFQRRFQLQQTLCQLHQAGLDSDQELTQLIREPSKLIQELYLLPCVLDDQRQEQTDINNLSDQIADVNEVNLYEIRVALLDKWLLGSSQVVLDETMTFGAPSEDNPFMEDNLHRVLYLLESRDRSFLLEHVAAIVNMSEYEVNQEARQRALFSLLKVGNDEELSSLLPSYADWL